MFKSKCKLFFFFNLKSKANIVEIINKVNHCTNDGTYNTLKVIIYQDIIHTVSLLLIHATENIFNGSINRIVGDPKTAQCPISKDSI